MEIAAYARDLGYTVGYITWTTGTTSLVYYQLLQTMDTYFSIIYSVLCDQLHIVT